MKINPRIAHIVPVGHLEQTFNNSYHMSLAHLVDQSETYRQFYRRMSEEGKFVIMDNGCAENAQLSTDKLIKMAECLYPTEIVLPDTLYDGKETFEKSEAARTLFENALSFKPRYMVVPQGHTVEEWFESAKQLLKLSVDTIGVSKFLPIITKDPDSRMKAVKLLTQYLDNCNMKNIEIHLLGCDEGPAKMREIFIQSPYVRGCDTAFAFIAAQGNVIIDQNTLRPEGEIDFLHGTVNHLKLNTAMQAFNTIAGVRSNTGVWC